jgi:hypothetical protein
MPEGAAPKALAMKPLAAAMQVTIGGTIAQKENGRPVRGPAAQFGLSADRGYQRWGDLRFCLVGGL